MIITNEEHVILSITSKELNLLEDALRKYIITEGKETPTHLEEKKAHKERMTLGDQMYQELIRELQRQWQRDEMQAVKIRSFAIEPRF
ncbi:hypothetical protein LCGC14_1148070 [marine sediment metagenome]|uniref:Uncharacterized protein n=1 Tax=marine sediment metagenome TaxID=412755 RepID=A0A0F9M196_9ZZZZ